MSSCYHLGCILLKIIIVIIAAIWVAFFSGWLLPSGLHSSQDGSDIIVDRPGKQEIARKMAMIKDYLRQKGFDVLQRRTVRLYFIKREPSKLCPGHFTHAVSCF